MDFFLIKMTPQVVEIVGAALRELPYKLAAPVIADFDRQIQEQQAAAVTTVAESKE